MPTDVGFQQARRASERALELAPDLPDALLTLGFGQFNVDLDPAAAKASAERALGLSPGSYDVQLAYSGFEYSLGESERAIESARKAVELDPIAPGAYVNLSNALYFARQYEESARAIRHAMSLAPGRPASHYYLGLVLLQQGRNDEALAEFNLESISWQRMFGRAFTFARTGKPDLARAEMAAMQKAFGDAASYQYAQIHAALGDRDEAFASLAAARRVHDPGLMGQVYVDPLLDNLRPDPRFDTLMRELGFTTGT
jgi:Tfp pilus assembly protein PilF